MTTAVRLLRVTIQAVFVAEDDGDLVEVPVQPIDLRASAFKKMNPATFVEVLTARISEQLAGPEPAGEPDQANSPEGSQ